jgi:hypothetical protein
MPIASGAVVVCPLDHVLLQSFGRSSRGCGRLFLWGTSEGYCSSHFLPSPFEYEQRMVGITAVRPYPPLSENVHECEELRGNGWFYSRGLGRSVGMLLQQLPMRLCQQMERGIRRRNLLPEESCDHMLVTASTSTMI